MKRPCLIALITIMAAGCGGGSQGEANSDQTGEPNAAPVVEGLADRYEVPEGEVSGTAVKTNDPNGDHLIISLSGADGDRFQYSSDTGALTFKQPPDYELPGDSDADGTCEVTVSVNDGEARVEQSTQVTVVNSRCDP